MRDDSQLMFSIKVSVRLFSSYQNDVGISKSVSCAAALRSLTPREEQQYVNIMGHKKLTNPPITGFALFFCLVRGKRKGGDEKPNG